MDEKEAEARPVMGTIFLVLAQLTTSEHYYKHYSGISEKGTLWDQYKFKWSVPFIEDPIA